MNLEEFPKGYQRLVKQVRKIDTEAADYLANEAPKLEGFARQYYLTWCFEYRKTPQGRRYWEEIDAELQKPRAEYTDLVQRITDLGVDRAILDYLNNEAMDLESFDLTYDLSRAFTWRHTPQGDDFWRCIAKQLYIGEAIGPGGAETPKTAIPEYPDMEAVQKRFFKLLEFKREHCPDFVFEIDARNFSVYYGHIEERWGTYSISSAENPAEILLR